MIELRSASAPSRGIRTVLWFLAVFYCLWLVRGWIVAESRLELILAGVGGLAIFICAKIISDWRNGLYFFFAWLLFEDLVRKYMGNNMAIYFGKDLLVGVTYASFFAIKSRSVSDTFRPPFRFALGLFVLMGLVQVFNPNSPSLLYGLLGLKLDFYYIPLMFVGYALVRTELDLHRFLVASMGLAGVIALLGIIQSIVGLDFLNPKTLAPDIELLGHLTRYTSAGIAVPRPCSVFVSDGRFASYLILTLILGVGTTGYLLLRTMRGRKVVFPAVALVGVAAMMSGSRGAFLYAGASLLVLSAGLLWGAPPRSAETYRLVKAIRRSFMLVAISLGLTITIFPQQIGARWTFYRETLSPDSPDFEFSDRIGKYPGGQFALAFSDPEWVTGHGIGTASLGGQYVTRLLAVRATNIAVESGYGVLVLELGVLGLVLWLVWTLSLIFAACKVVLRLKGTWAFPVAFSILWFAFLLLFPLTYAGFAPYQNFVLNAYLWMLVGILFRLPTLVNQASPPASSTSSLLEK